MQSPGRGVERTVPLAQGSAKAALYGSASFIVRAAPSGLEGSRRARTDLKLMKPQFAARLFCLAALLVSIVPTPGGQALTQSPSSRKPAGLVVGQVVDAATSRPVAAAIVTIAPAVTGADRPAPASPVSSPNRRVVADDQGRFLFRDLAMGTYLFSAAAPGYLNGGYGQRQPGGTTQPFALAEDERAGDVTVRLWKAATVGGTVSDDAGGPVVGVWVSIARREFAGGRLQLSVPESSWAYNAGPTIAAPTRFPILRRASTSSRWRPARPRCRSRLSTPTPRHWGRSAPPDRTPCRWA